jgi:hypothetical protein
MTKTQDPKFYIQDNRLHGQSGIVPDDEPLFILRARDVNALAVLSDYLKHAIESGANTEHHEAICRRINDFARFRTEHPKRMKIPDTSVALMHDGKP